MKVKIKGLVFVGFAAMIFAANAAFAEGTDKTVTSKSYVDTELAKKQVKSSGASVGGDNGTWNPLDNTIPTENASTTTAPTTAAVRAALNNATSIDNFVSQTITDGVQTKAPSEDAVHDALALKEDASNKVTSMDSQSTDAQYPSAKAVYDALHNTANVGNGALTVTVDGGTVTGSFAANQADPSTIAITGLESSANKTQTIDTTATAEQKAANYPSQAAVENYVATQAAVSNFVEDRIQDAVTNKAPSENAVFDALAEKQNANTAVTHTQGTAVGDSSTPVYIDSTGAAQPTSLGTAANANVSTTGVDDNETGLVSGDQVHDYINGLNNGQAFPTMPAACATEPCALVNMNGTITWERIAQAGDNVGA